MSPLEIFKAEEDRQLQIHLNCPELKELVEKPVLAELGKVDESRWVIGQKVSIARKRIDNDRILGRYMSAKFADVPTRRLNDYRHISDAFGDKQEEVAFIPMSSLYELAAPKIDDNRLAILDDLKERCPNDIKATGKLVKEVIEEYYPSKVVESAPEPIAEPAIEPVDNSIEEEWPDMKGRLRLFMSGEMSAEKALLIPAKSELAYYANALADTFLVAMGDEYPYETDALKKARDKIVADFKSSEES